jgi:hypothetical protein
MIAPPRVAELLLESLGAQTAFRDSLLGDLAEEFALRVERDGIGAARRWYCRESIRATPHLLRDWARSLRPRDLSHLAGVVLSSYVFLVMLAGFLAAVVRSTIVTFGVPLDLQLFRAGNLLLHAIGLPLGAIGAIMGGYIAAWLHDRAPLVSALALGVVWSCVDLSVLRILGGIPAWYQFAVPVVVVVGTATGGALRVCGSQSLGRGRRPA